MTDSWDLYNRICDQPIHSLPIWQQQLVAVCNLRQEVGANGLTGYFYYSYGDSAPIALEVLPSILGQSWADLLLQAMQVFGPNYPTESETRSGLLDEIDVEDRLDELDNAFYALETATNADMLMNGFVIASNSSS